MNVYTYNDPIPELEDAGLIELWAESWRKYGWNPVVLSKEDARNHPTFEQFERSINRLPSVNIRDYENACYFRWLAMTTTNGGMMSDFDVINYGFSPVGVVLTDTCTLYERNMPSVVSGSPLAFAKVCAMFCEFKPDENCFVNHRPHCSDMLVVAANAAKLLENAQCLEYTDPAWETAKLVHFATAKLNRPKAKRIVELRKP